MGRFVVKTLRVCSCTNILYLEAEVVITVTGEVSFDYQNKH